MRVFMAGATGVIGRPRVRMLGGAVNDVTVGLISAGPAIVHVRG